jgi:hypothetical protein
MSHALGPMYHPRLKPEWLRYNLESRTVPELRKDLVYAFDEIDELKRKAERQLVKLWIYRFALGAEAGLVGWLAAQLLARLH